MVRELHLKAEVLPGGRIEVTDAELPVGQTVEIVVRSAADQQAAGDHQPVDRRRTIDLDEFWPVHPTAVWPKGLSLRREDMYEDRI